ncbi:MAG: hypothetical protein CMJ42_07755 [Phyllobacteriaceae bacterium]|nr:hypothetical protein [Phyllobacteriaceae bacterium]MBA92407.1 hypothetical protein [Phyllobacteriaceae bacterium]|tara:strand:- start:7 stop:420 length:414 start_codon:yes stop_codon:yes gene_type:complete
MKQDNSAFGLRHGESGYSGAGNRAKDDILIVTADRVSRIVIEGTLKRMGKTCRAMEPSTMASVEDMGMPALVIFECSNASELCRHYSGVFTGKGRPRIIMFTNQGKPDDGMADIILRRPIIPDQLEQVILTLLGPEA